MWYIFTLYCLRLYLYRSSISAGCSFLAAPFSCSALFSLTGLVFLRRNSSNLKSFILLCDLTHRRAQTLYEMPPIQTLVSIPPYACSSRARPHPLPGVYAHRGISAGSPPRSRSSSRAGSRAGSRRGSLVGGAAAGVRLRGASSGSGVSSGFSSPSRSRRGSFAAADGGGGDGGGGGAVSGRRSGKRKPRPQRSSAARRLAAQAGVLLRGDETTDDEGDFAFAPRVRMTSTLGAAGERAAAGGGDTEGGNDGDDGGGDDEHHADAGGDAGDDADAAEERRHRAEVAQWAARDHGELAE